MVNRKCKIKIKIKQNTGITLVALVVTIVVLLILAGITIMYVMGDNGVFGKARNAKERTEIAKYQETLESAKAQIIIKGLGKLDIDQYFNELDKREIINKNADVIDNADGSYEVIVDDEYVFLITVVPDEENPTDARIEYLNEVGKLEPMVKSIRVVEKAKTSLKVKVTARLEGGIAKCYYKKASEVAENEAESDISGYRDDVTLDSNLTANITGLTAGTTYKIKAVIQKDGKNTNWKSIEESTLPPNPVESITLDKPTVKIAKDGTVQLNVTVKPDTADNKKVKWSTDSSNVATVSSTGMVTGVGGGTAKITATADDGSGVKAECIVTVTGPINKDTMTSDAKSWEAIDRAAKAIAKSGIGSDSLKATGKTELGETYTINVGDEFSVQYNGADVKVRVLGFNHDDLSEGETYEGEPSLRKAGISFEFLDFMTGTRYMYMIYKQRWMG